MQRLSNILAPSTLRPSQLSLRVVPRFSSTKFIPSTSTAARRVFMRPMASTPFPSLVPHEHLIKDKIADYQERRQMNKKEQTIEERWRDKSKKALEDAANAPPAHAYTGRTVLVKEDLASAYRALDQILQRNKVRATLRSGERHEKKGVKRRRLSSQRWRKRFAEEVRKKVQLVMKIRDRGA